MKRVRLGVLVAQGTSLRTVIGGGGSNGSKKGEYVPMYSKKFLDQLSEQREWRERTDTEAEKVAAKMYDSNENVPKTHRYNIPQGFGVRRRMRVVKSDKDPKEFQKSLDSSQLTMNFK